MNASLALRIQLKIIFGSFYLNLTFRTFLGFLLWKKKYLQLFIITGIWLFIGPISEYTSTRNSQCIAQKRFIQLRGQSNCFFYNLCYTISIYVILYLPIGQPIQSYLFLSFQINDFWNFYNTFSSFFFFFQRSKS